MEQPIKRSRIRQKLGLKYYTLRRKLWWMLNRDRFAKTKLDYDLPYLAFAHKSILMRKLKDVDMWMQENKVINLKLAVAELDGIVLKPGELFSYWRLIGRPSAKRGYVDGMVLTNTGGFRADVGGGLCQLSNLIFWMTAHTPLTIVERHRHGYDVFPDSNRTQPFGSGATCQYPHYDLMIQNDTEDTYQIRLVVGSEYLEGAWMVSEKPSLYYDIEEREHQITGELWGGYTRHNELYQLSYEFETGKKVGEKLLVKNSAIMMYQPFLSDSNM